MTRQQRLRRVGILCCHFLRNLAFYKAGWSDGVLILKDQFWVSANGNFLDISVLEWCKLFAEKRGQHHWRKVITDQGVFLLGLLEAIGCSESEFKAYIDEMKAYRDKFVAHLDSEEVMNIPDLGVAEKSVSFLYDYLRGNEEEDECFRDAPATALDFYEKFHCQGRAVYSELNRDI